MRFFLWLLRHSELRGELGFGSYGASTLLRPGAFVGIGYAPAAWLDFTLRGGMHAVFDDDLGVRGDLAARARIASTFHVGAGLALSSGRREIPEPEGRLFLTWSP